MIILVGIRWEEKKQRAVAEAEAKKKLHEKIAANPFAFLVDDSEEEEVMM